MGVPNDPAFQKRLLLTLLKLFEMPKPEGPEPWILEDYPEDAPEVKEDELIVLSCPVDYGKTEEEPEDADPMHAAFLREIRSLRPWYDMAVAKRKRTTVGVSHVDLDDIGDFLYAFVRGTMPENPRQDVDLSTSLKAAVEDLRAYYFEAVTSQPGWENVSNQALLDWYWEETVAGKVLLQVVDACLESPDEPTKYVAEHLFIAPREVFARHTGKDPFAGMPGATGGDQEERD